MDRLVRTLGLALLVGLLALGLLFFQSQAGMSPTDLVSQTLTAQGFSAIEVNWKPASLVCQSGEQGYAFTAVNSNGAPVQGVVCARNSVAVRHAYIV
jgi:hypothetical protein